MESPGVLRDLSLSLCVWEKDPRDGLWPGMTVAERRAHMTLCSFLFLMWILGIKLSSSIILAKQSLFPTEPSHLSLPFEGFEKGSQVARLAFYA